MYFNFFLLSLIASIVYTSEYDWHYIAAFREENKILSKLPPGTNQVVFIGDSITQNWGDDWYFTGKPYINRGIGGQTSKEIMLRFREDVIRLNPDIVVILAGANDIYFNFETSFTIRNLQTMAELADFN